MTDHDGVLDDVRIADRGDVVMLPWREALGALSGRTVRLRLLVPPYPALGVGALRALRVRALEGEHDGAFELMAGYDGYERL